MATIGKRLRWARDRKGWSLSELAAEANMSRSFIWSAVRFGPGAIFDFETRRLSLPDMWPRRFGWH